MPTVHRVSRTFLVQLGVSHPPQTVNEIKSQLQRDQDYFKFPNEPVQLIRDQEKNSLILDNDRANFSTEDNKVFINGPNLGTSSDASYSHSPIVQIAQLSRKRKACSAGGKTTSTSYAPNSRASLRNRTAPLRFNNSLELQRPPEAAKANGDTLSPMVRCNDSLEVHRSPESAKVNGETLNAAEAFFAGGETSTSYASKPRTSLRNRMTPVRFNDGVELCRSLKAAKANGDTLKAAVDHSAPKEISERTVGVRQIKASGNWQVEFSHKGKRVYVGTYKSRDQAISVNVAAREQLRKTSHSEPTSKEIQQHLRLAKEAGREAAKIIEIKHIRNPESSTTKPKFAAAKISKSKNEEGGADNSPPKEIGFSTAGLQQTGSGNWIVQVHYHHLKFYGTYDSKDKAIFVNGFVREKLKATRKSKLLPDEIRTNLKLAKEAALKALRQKAGIEHSSNSAPTDTKNREKQSPIESNTPGLSLMNSGKWLVRFWYRKAYYHVGTFSNKEHAELANSVARKIMEATGDCKLTTNEIGLIVKQAKEAAFTAVSQLRDGVVAQTSSGKWKVEVSYQNATHYIGTFVTKEQAILVNAVARGILTATRDMKLSADEVERNVELAEEAACEALLNRKNINPKGKVDCHKPKLIPGCLQPNVQEDKIDKEAEGSEAFTSFAGLPNPLGSEKQRKVANGVVHKNDLPVSVVDLDLKYVSKCRGTRIKLSSQKGYGPKLLPCHSQPQMAFRLWLQHKKNIWKKHHPRKFHEADLPAKSLIPTTDSKDCEKKSSLGGKIVGIYAVQSGKYKIEVGYQGKKLFIGSLTLRQAELANRVARGQLKATRRLALTADEIASNMKAAKEAALKAVSELKDCSDPDTHDVLRYNSSDSKPPVARKSGSATTAKGGQKEVKQYGKTAGNAFSKAVSEHTGKPIGKVLFNRDNVELRDDASCHGLWISAEGPNLAEGELAHSENETKTECSGDATTPDALLDKCRVSNQGEECSLQREETKKTCNKMDVKMGQNCDSNVLWNSKDPSSMMVTAGTGDANDCTGGVLEERRSGWGPKVVDTNKDKYTGKDMGVGGCCRRTTEGSNLAEGKVLAHSENEAKAGCSGDATIHCALIDKVCVADQGEECRLQREEVEKTSNTMDAYMGQNCASNVLCNSFDPSSMAITPRTRYANDCTNGGVAKRRLGWGANIVDMNKGEHAGKDMGDVVGAGGRSRGVVTNNSHGDIREKGDGRENIVGSSCERAQTVVATEYYENHYVQPQTDENASLLISTKLPPPQSKPTTKQFDSWLASIYSVSVLPSMENRTIAPKNATPISSHQVSPPIDRQPISSIPESSLANTSSYCATLGDAEKEAEDKHIGELEPGNHVNIDVQTLGHFQRTGHGTSSVQLATDQTNISHPHELSEHEVQSQQVCPGVTWFYLDGQSRMQGPYGADQMRQWYESGYLTDRLQISESCDGPFRALSAYFSDRSKSFKCCADSSHTLTTGCPPQACQVSPCDTTWFYVDHEGRIQGPHANNLMRHWFESGYLNGDLQISQAFNGPFQPFSSGFPDCSKSL